jgi:hypothetical protein
VAETNIRLYSAEIIVFDAERKKVIERLRQLQEVRNLERAYEQRDYKKGADERYWDAEREERNKSLNALYNYPFKNFVERFDEALVLGDNYERLLDKPIGYYLLAVARARYLQTVKSE